MSGSSRPATWRPDSRNGWPIAAGRSAVGTSPIATALTIAASAAACSADSRMVRPLRTPGVVPSGSSRTISVSDRETKRLDQKGSGTGAVDEEIGLAPLDEEDVLGVAHRKTAKKQPTESDKQSIGDLAGPSDASTGSGKVGSGSSKARSLIEEELHDPELDEIRRKVAQRAQFNPLQPPGYVPSEQRALMGCLGCCWRSDRRGARHLAAGRFRRRQLIPSVACFRAGHRAKHWSRKACLRR